MKSFLVFIGILFASQFSYALSATNCSNADGSVRIVEKEVWGTNPIGCYYNGTAVESGHLIKQNNTRKEIDSRKLGDIMDSTLITYTVRVKLSKTNHSHLAEDVESVITTLICEHKKNNAMDLAGGMPPCQIDETDGALEDL